MAIVIQNISEKPSVAGLNKYVVKINNRAITTFGHIRADGLARCLFMAAAAVRKMELDQYLEGEK